MFGRLQRKRPFFMFPIDSYATVLHDKPGADIGHSSAERHQIGTQKIGFTSIARTITMTGAIVARMIAKGMLRPGDRVFVNPEKVVSGYLNKRCCLKDW
jgi:hypothetical protein